MPRTSHTHSRRRAVAAGVLGAIAIIGGAGSAVAATSGAAGASVPPSTSTKPSDTTKPSVPGSTTPSVPTTSQPSDTTKPSVPTVTNTVEKQLQPIVIAPRPAQVVVRLPVTG
ncbi:hypothetical protein Lesp02_03890 [Lentzea sp. NBRC 105346]|nr:hypothetical protein Lesp02_03890 [Lentzea sp. NBRC 105346]